MKSELKIKSDMALFNINGARSCVVTGEFLIYEVNITWDVVSSKGNCCLYNLPAYKKGHYITVGEQFKAAITSHRIHTLSV